MLKFKWKKRWRPLRGYDSVIDYLLERQDVSVDLYNRQIDVIMDELAPHMRRYAQLIVKSINWMKFVMRI